MESPHKRSQPVLWWPRSKIHSCRMFLGGLWIYFAGSCHCWDTLCWWGRKQGSGQDLSQGCHQLESSLRLLPPATPKLPQHQHHPKAPCWGGTRASPVPPKLPPHAQGAFRAEGWDLHSQSLRALSTDPSTCLCQLMEVIFTSFHLENRRQKSSNNFPGSRSIEEISLAHSQQVILRVLLRGDCSGSGCRAALGNLCVPHPHSTGHWDTQQGQTLPTLSFASPPSSLVPAL